jgi:hypothetical protein
MNDNLHKTNVKNKLEFRITYMHTNYGDREKLTIMHELV